MQTKAGGIKARQVMVIKYGGEEGYISHLREQGKKGGSAKVKKGFAISGLASSAGRKGGAHSSRKGVKNGFGNNANRGDFSYSNATDGGFKWDAQEA